MTSAVSDESVAGDSGVYEPSERKYDGVFPFWVTCARDDRLRLRQAGPPC